MSQKKKVTDSLDGYVLDYETNKPHKTGVAKGILGRITFDFRRKRPVRGHNKI